MQISCFKCPMHFISAAIEAVEPSASYYEKMSEELEKIVNEVKNSPTEEHKMFTDSVQLTVREYCTVHTYALYKINIF